MYKPNQIVTTSNRNVKVYPNGTGVVEIKGNDNDGHSIKLFSKFSWC